MFQFPREFVLFDLEYTAFEDSKLHKWSRPGEHREIIQIGAIRATSPDLNEQDSFLEYVRPAINPQLSDFIVGLTGITQIDIDSKGIPYPNAYRKFKTFVGMIPAFCWGDDADVFAENNELADEPEELPNGQFQNLRPILAPEFAAIGIDISTSSSGTLIQEFGTADARRAHDALNDMRNLLDAIRLLRRRR
ncbi:exonuclease domain-containing protein [Candidatus Kaiserbacteria bacterium]|nr:exonuclease domain-containing protein [Candidatus Kaiserbacteria bacterium]